MAGIFTLLPYVRAARQGLTNFILLLIPAEQHPNYLLRMRSLALIHLMVSKWHLCSAVRLHATGSGIVVAGGQTSIFIILLTLLPKIFHRTVMQVMSFPC